MKAIYAIAIGLFTVVATSLLIGAGGGVSGGGSGGSGSITNINNTTNINQTYYNSSNTYVVNVLDFLPGHAVDRSGTLAGYLTNSLCLQNAINSVTNVPDGFQRIVRLPNGPYPLGTNVNITVDNVIIEGGGPMYTEVQRAIDSNPYCFIFVTNGMSYYGPKTTSAPEYVIFRNFSINGGTRHFYTKAIICRGDQYGPGDRTFSRRLRLENIKVYQFGYVLDADALIGCALYNVDMDNNIDLYLKRVDRFTAINCSIGDNNESETDYGTNYSAGIVSTTGFEGAAGMGSTILNCEFGTQMYGIDIQAGSPNWFIGSLHTEQNRNAVVRIAAGMSAGNVVISGGRSFSSVNSQYTPFVDVGVGSAQALVINGIISDLGGTNAILIRGSGEQVQYRGTSVWVSNVADHVTYQVGYTNFQGALIAPNSINSNKFDAPTRALLGIGGATLLDATNAAVYVVNTNTSTTNKQNFNKGFVTTSNSIIQSVTDASATHPQLELGSMSDTTDYVGIRYVTRDHSGGDFSSASDWYWLFRTNIMTLESELQYQGFSRLTVLQFDASAGGKFTWTFNTNVTIPNGYLKVGPTQTITNFSQVADYLTVPTARAITNLPMPLTVGGPATWDNNTLGIGNGFIGVKITAPFGKLYLREKVEPGYTTNIITATYLTTNNVVQICRLSGKFFSTGDNGAAPEFTGVNDQTNSLGLANYTNIITFQWTNTTGFTGKEWYSLETGPVNADSVTNVVWFLGTKSIWMK